MPSTNVISMLAAHLSISLRKILPKRVSIIISGEIKHPLLVGLKTNNVANIQSMIPLYVK